MLIKTSELIGKPLDCAVAVALGLKVSQDGSRIMKFDPYSGWDDFLIQNYSTDWAYGGPIIDREHIWLRGPNDACKPDGTVVLNINFWYAHQNHGFVQNGPTALIAAMRCFVASKLGAEIEISLEIQNA